MRKAGAAIVVLLLSTASHADWIERGHLKGQYLGATYPEDSLLRDALGASTHDGSGELRLLFGGGQQPWRWHADYQVLVQSGDTLALSETLGGNFLIPAAVPNDDHRLLDLTKIVDDGARHVLAHRLDRLHLDYIGTKTVLKIGRQAVSWGNGLIYNPVDFFNPFDPAAVDTEYKTGDDMLYGQYLQDSGNDLQGVWVWRRDDHGDTSTSVNTEALKYHAFIGEQELDVLVARHFEDDVIAFGGSAALGGALVRGDLMVTDTAEDTYLSAVVNLSYSWTWGGHNVSGVVEYFHNGLGLHEAEYTQLEAHPDLLARLQRGELYTVGRNYLAGNLTVEISPLFQLFPTLFLNLGDHSGLGQVSGRYDLSQNVQLLFAVNVPFGEDGSEYGGLPAPVPGKDFAAGPGIFGQLAWYF